MSVTDGAGSRERTGGRVTMDGMTPAHAKPARRDHLWVVVIIAGFALYDVWKAWSELGAKSGFGHAGWTLTVIVEVFWLYVLWAWLAGAAGPRSRKFARRSAAGVFLLSLVGQASSRLNVHRTPSAAVVVFVSVLPVVVLALIAFLVHYRQLDRAEAAEGEREAAEDGLIAALRAEMGSVREAARAQLEALTGELETAHLAASEAGRRESEALTRAEAAERKLAAKTAQAKRSKTAHEDDLTTEMRALTLFEKNPELRKPGMGAELGRQLGKSAQTGRRLHSKLTAQDPPGGRSAQAADERSGERS